MGLLQLWMNITQISFERWKQQDLMYDMQAANQELILLRTATQSSNYDMHVALVINDIEV